MDLGLLVSIASLRSGVLMWPARQSWRLVTWSLRQPRRLLWPDNNLYRECTMLDLEKDRLETATRYFHVLGRTPAETEFLHRRLLNIPRNIEGPVEHTEKKYRPRITIPQTRGCPLCCGTIAPIHSVASARETVLPPTDFSEPSDACQCSTWNATLLQDDVQGFQRYGGM